MRYDPFGPLSPGHLLRNGPADGHLATGKWPRGVKRRDRTPTAPERRAHAGEGELAASTI